MPVVTVQMISGRTTLQKRQFIEEITEVTMRNLEVPESAVTIVLSEVAAEDWGSGGKTMAELREARTHLERPNRCG